MKSILIAILAAAAVAGYLIFYSPSSIPDNGDIHRTAEAGSSISKMNTDSKSIPSLNNQAEPDTGKAGLPENTLASPLPVDSSPAIARHPETETGSPPDSLPKPVPLGRETRDPQGAARTAAQQAADHERQVADSAAPRPGQELQNARVGAEDIGLPFLPNSRQDMTRSSRTAEPGYGSTVSTELQSKLSLEAALAYYRQQLRDKLPQSRIDETRTGPEFATLSASSLPPGTRVSVMLSASPTGTLSVTLSRWDAGAPVAPSSPEDPVRP